MHRIPSASDPAVISFSRLETLRNQGLLLYPSRSRRTHRISDICAIQRMGEIYLDILPIRLAGRVVRWSVNEFVLSDASHEVLLVLPPDLFESVKPWIELEDVVEVSIKQDASLSRWIVLEITLLAPCLHPAGSANQQPSVAGADITTLVERARIMKGIRDFFSEQGFLEVETPIMARDPGLEPYLDPFESRYKTTPTATGSPVFFLTSPEYAMKRLIVNGLERIFQISRVFRNGECGPMHNPEFTMLEWYRAYASYLEIATDIEALVVYLAKLLGKNFALEYQGHSIDLDPPWPRLTVRDAFIQYTGIDLKGSDAVSLRQKARVVGVSCRDADTWEDVFFRLLVTKVEPRLGFDRPVILTDYPSTLAALAKVRPDEFPVAERFEVYLAGVELANAFSELNDPEEQNRRFDEERDERKRLGFPVFDPDRAYLTALARAMPPVGGIALGVDRLVMMLLNLPNVRATLAFPFELDSHD